MIRAGNGLALLIGLGAATASATSAAAQTTPESFVAACRSAPGMPLPPGIVLSVILTNERVAWSPELIRAFQYTVEPRPGMVRLADVEDRAARDALVDSLQALITSGPSRPHEGITVQAAQGDPRTLARQYMRGDFSVLTISCPSPDPDTQTQNPPAPPIQIALGADVSDLFVPFSERGFATLGYVNNRESNSEFIDAQFVLGTEPFEAMNASWAIYSQYQRRTRAGNELNDLAFGVIGQWRGHDQLIRWSGSFETDDDFDSRQYRAEIDWELPSIQACKDEMWERRFLTCRFGLRADYAVIDDPGQKASLFGVEDYLRVGAWTQIAYGHRIGSGSLEAVFEYELMEPIDGDYGDAAVGRFSLSYIPSETDHFSFGVTYENGEDITSLVRSDIIKLTLGVRY